MLTIVSRGAHIAYAYAHKIIATTRDRPSTQPSAIGAYTNPIWKINKKY